MHTLLRRACPPAAALILAGALSAPALAGSLFPPPGPPAPTMKRLDEVSTARCISSLPHTITEPGRYEVCGDLLLEGSGSGITISSSDVTLDLAGFTLRGGPSSRNGIQLTAGADNVTIRNGSLVGWGENGVNAVATDGELYCWGLNVRSSTGHGIYLSRGKVERCVLTANRGDGVRAWVPDLDGDGYGDPVMISDTTSSGNLGAGIAGRNARLSVERCVTVRNGGNGLCAQPAEDGMPYSSLLVRDHQASGNGGSGISVQNYFIDLERCTTSTNAAHGLYLLLDDGIVAPDMKAKTYNSTRSNRTGGIISGGNGGNGVLVEYAGEVDASFLLSDSSITGNGGNGVGVVPVSEDASSLRVTLERCETSRNASSGVHVTVRNDPPTLSSCVSNNNGMHGYSLRFMEATMGMKAAAKTYNSSRSNKSEGVANGGSGFHVEADDGVFASVVLEGGDFSGNGQHGVRYEPSGGGSEPGDVCITLEHCRTNSNEIDGVSLSSSKGGSDSRNLLCGKTDHLISGGNGGNGLTAEGVHEVSVLNSDLSGNGGHGAEHKSAEGGDIDVLAWSWSSSRSSYNNNGGDGVSIHCPAANIRMDSCVASGNGGAGVRTVQTSKADAKKALDGFVARNNGDDGIHVSGPVAVSLDRCEASSNAGHGLSHIIDALDPDDDGDGIPTRIENSSFSGNSHDGVHLSLHGEGVIHRDLAARNVLASGNGGNGIHMDHRQGDLLLPSSVSLADSSCPGNGASGIRVFAEVCVVRSCLASSNGDAGMRLFASSLTVADSTLARNEGGQLWCWGRGSVRSCDIDGAGGSGDGIHVADGIFDIRDNFVAGASNTEGTAVGVRLPDGNSVIRGTALIGNDRATSLVDDGNPLYEGTGVRGENPLYTGD